jgi:hypothetical protein
LTFVNDDAIFRALYLAIRNASKKWTMPIKQWGMALNQVSHFVRKRAGSALVAKCYLHKTSDRPDVGVRIDMYKIFNILVIGLFSIFILIFGTYNYSKTGESIFLFFTKVYFLMFFISIVFFHLLKKILNKIINLFSRFWYLFLMLEGFFFFALICIKLFFVKTMDIGIYHSDIFVFILFGYMVSCHYWWVSLRNIWNA